MRCAVACSVSSLRSVVCWEIFRIGSTGDGWKVSVHVFTTHNRIIGYTAGSRFFCSALSQVCLACEPFDDAKLFWQKLRTNMELPNYFIADLPADHAVTPKLVTDACHTLKQNRAHYLLGRSTASIVHVLAATAQSWTEPHNLFRKLALERGVKETGFAEVTLARGLDLFFQQFTAENLNALIAQDLGL